MKYQKITKSFSIEKSSGTKLAVIIHLYYTDSWPLIKEKLANINVPFDLFISVQEQDKNIILDEVNTHHKTTNIIVLPNRGRDVLPFLLIARKISEEKQYKYILKLHSKKSLHRNDGNEWLDSLLDELIPANISAIIKTLELTDTGAIGPASHVVSLSKYMGGNRDLIGLVLEKMTDRKTIDHILFNQSKYHFFVGTMFWCRIDFLSPLLSSNLTPADFNTESRQVDGTTAHAIERILGKILHKITDKKMYILKKSLVSELPEKQYNSKYKHVG
jgi:lipopolysaccharide biosynthesis protein